MKPKAGKKTSGLAARLAVRRGEFVQLRRRVLSHRWAWLVVFVVGCGLLITPARSSRYPVLTAGEVAVTDVVVERDVVLPDPEATEESRRRASLEVLPVYVFDGGLQTGAGEKLQRVFDEGRRQPQGVAAELARRLGEASDLVIPPREAEALRALHFSEELLGVLAETAQRLYRQGIVGDRAELLRVAEKGITLRDARSGEERVELDVFRFIDGGGGLAETVEQKLADEPSVARNWRAPLASFLARVLRPNVTFDRTETLARRLRAAESVQEVSIRLPQGRVLVRRGDEVSSQVARVLAALSERNSPSRVVLPLMGVLLLNLLLAAAWLFFSLRQAPSPDEALVRFGAITVLTVVLLLLTRGFAFLAGGVAGAVMRHPFGHVELYLPALPHATGPILAGLMFGLPFGMLFAAVQALQTSLMVGGDAGLAVFAMTSGMSAVFAAQRLRDRYVLARVGALVAGVNVLVVLGLALWQGKPPAPEVLAVQMVAGGFGGLVAAILASFLLPLLEALTGTVTDIRLLELSNPNLPLLKRLSVEAPGTFQHSLAMANLAEEAAEAIGANPLLARVCCYYHDIGKLVKPEYFVENQRGENPHDNLTPWMSALVVSNHVKAGLELARQYRLPEPIRDAIATHHGTKLIHFFYSRAKERANGDSGAVPEDEFRYPGPRPISKEMGILLLADAVEAASRTLHDPTPGKIQAMIDQVIKNVLEDGQLDECELTLRDVEKIGAEFYWVLTNVFHHRIDYPGFDFNRRRRG
ncbi:MAG: HDIG domain-containing protein [Thermoanaerobaculaceae bacterium]|nr:HDIG domain-containing protein [Thermoanaerobaculaceae bacterium]MDI9621040.1 HDIG domain-containing protein [Acidobacteriota bacterium]NLH11028.1 HDIG domain-containing protein [Holophagae bacterium]HPW55845.1 HDIG domain-containing protein [Thermoanaerobaculaceae bacterium]